jgi:hypothetical protein
MAAGCCYCLRSYLMLINKFDAVYSQNDASIGVGDLCSKLWVFPMSELLLFPRTKSQRQT